MWVLIDGYNLLFATDLVGQGRGPGWLKSARQRLLSVLVQTLPVSVSTRTVLVFDSQQPSGSGDAERVSGIEVEFATDYAEADDLLEAVIRRHPHPKKLAVVSGDHRILTAARRRRAAGYPAEQWYDALQAGEVLLAPAIQPLLGETVESVRQPAVRSNRWLADFGLAPAPSAADIIARPPTPVVDRPQTPRSHDPADTRRARRPLDQSEDLERLFGDLVEEDDEID